MKDATGRENKHRPRGVDPARYRADLDLRSRVRAFLRKEWPDIEVGFGGSWLYMPFDLRCPDCAAALTQVRVPGAEPLLIVYCGSCGIVAATEKAAL